MIDFIIYIQPRKREKGVLKDEYLLDELLNFPGTSRMEELELIRNGKLKIISNMDIHRIFKFSCDFQIRLVASTKPIFAPLSFSLWQRKHGPIVATFEGRRKASKVAVALLSLALYGDPFAINSITLTIADYRKLKKTILENLSGNLTQVFLRNIRSEKGTIRRFFMTGSGLEQFVDLEELLENASSVSGIGFAIPSFGGERKLSFRIKDWGGGQIYSPAEPLPHEISKLLELLEQTLLG